MGQQLQLSIYRLGSATINGLTLARIIVCHRYHSTKEAPNITFLLALNFEFGAEFKILLFVYSQNNKTKDKE